MPIGDLYRQADAYAAQVRARDAATLRQLADAYGRIYRDATARFELLNVFIQGKLDAGELVTAGRVIRSAQYRELVTQTRAAIDGFGEFAAGAVANEQDRAATAALVQSEHLLRVGTETGMAETVRIPGGRTLQDILPAFQRVPIEAVSQLVGTLGDGTPLRDYFLRGSANASALSDEVVDGIRDVVSRGLAGGWNPRKTAAELRRTMGIGLTRAMRIARTETLRSYREATRANYAANGIEEWEWLATLSDRTCLACLALDGQTFPIDQPMQSHVNCRCTMVPVLPFQVPRVRRVQDGGGEFVGTAGEWFGQLGGSTQRGMMGPGKFELFQQGHGLMDFLGARDSQTFGVSFVERSIQDVLNGRSGGAAHLRGVHEVASIIPAAHSGGITGLPTFQKLVDGTGIQTKSSGGNRLLGSVYADQGFDGLPNVISAAEADRLAKLGQEELWRGISSEDEPRPVSELMEEFRSGVYYPGYGMYGDGTYTASGRKGMETALTYGDGESSNVLRMVLRPDARVISYDDLIALRDQQETELLRSARTRAEKDAIAEMLYDPGVFAASMGFDAVRVRIREDVDFVNLLNRRAVQVVR